MITRAEAEAIVLERLNTNVEPSRRSAITAAWLKPYGWVIFYDSEVYVKTGDESERFYGGGPQVVTHEGTVHVLGSARSADAELAAFEHAHGLASGG